MAASTETPSLWQLLASAKAVTKLVGKWMGKPVFFGVGVIPAMALSVAIAHGQPVSQQEVMDSQGALSRRVQTATDAYARAHGIPHEIDVFCMLKMQNEPQTHVNDGFIPFGVNYYNVTDRQTLDRVIYSRETYETIYRKRCMAETKQLIGD
jgi:hypothetical protein